MSKAYDHVEWSFLKNIILRLGYRSQWINMLMQCVTSVKYTVCFNGSLGETFHPSRGLRQGNPLSPYLFLLYAEGLSTILNKAKISEVLKGECVNFGKSLIYFSKNVTPQIREEIGALFNVRIATNPEKYLRLPTMIGRNKREVGLLEKGVGWRIGSDHSVNIWNDP
ncbi:hypothetical protein GQ457_17G005910 [Hibiscus cannabinus]